LNFGIGNFQNLFVTIITFFLVLSFLVLIHELGHFTAAKIFKVKVLEFGFGLPPRLFGIKRGETTYSINALPIGGFVRLFGEEENDLKDNKSEAKRAFYSKPPLQKLTIILAGVFMNFMVAIVIISFIFTQGVYVLGTKVYVENVTDNSPAKIAGIMKGDQVAQIGNKKIESTEDLISAAKKYAGQKVEIVVGRKVAYEGQRLVFSLIPRKNPPKGEGALGVSVSNLEFKKYSVWQAPYYGTIETMKMTWLTAKGIVDIFGRLIMFREVPKEVAGPVGIAKLVGQAVNYGFMAVLQLMGLLSLNLAVINVFPFPALDGGRLMFVLIEIITRRRINPKFEAIVNTVGFFILIAVIILITRNDILRK
jgi:regulator of sigma E protease